MFIWLKRHLGEYPLVSAITCLKSPSLGAFSFSTNPSSIYVKGISSRCFHLIYYYSCEVQYFCSIVMEMKRQIPKTRIAMELIGKGMTAAQAARKLEISESGVYAALRKTKAKDLGCCPTCGHKLRK